MVVVVVVTTVVRVAGANESWPMLGEGPTVVVVLISWCSSMSRLRVDFDFDFEECGREVWADESGMGDASRRRDREAGSAISGRRRIEIAAVVA